MERENSNNRPLGQPLKAWIQRMKMLLTFIVCVFTFIGVKEFSYAQAPGCVQPPSGLVSWWPGDGSANDIQDGNHGTLQGGTTFAAGKVGQAFSFDGINDYVELGQPASLMPSNSNFTIVGWVLVPDYPSNAFPQCPSKYPVIDFTWGWTVGVIGDGRFRFLKYYTQLDNVVVSSASPISTNAFHHFAAVHTLSELRLYVDGELAGTVSSPTGTIYYEPGRTLRIGQGDCGDGRRNYKGQIDELAFFSRALSASEIQAIFAAGSAGKCTTVAPPTTPAPAGGLVGYWKLDEGSGSTAFDSSGNGNAGTINGATWARDGKINGALSFDGTDDYVSTNIDINPSGMPQLTMMAWVYPITTGGRRQVVSHDDGNYDRSLLMEGTGWNVFTGTSSWSTGAPVDLNGWQHVAVVYGTSNIKFYKNGVEFSFGSPGSLGSSGYKLNIGKNPGFGEFFPGKIDEVRIYNKALTQSEIQADMGIPPTPTPTPAGGLVVFRDDFNDGKMDGWTEGSLQGDWKVKMITASNGVLQQDSNTYDGTEGPEGTYIGTYVYAGDKSWTDYDFQVRMHPGDDDGIGVLFRYVDSSNYYRFLWVGDASSAGPFIRLDKIVGGVQTVLKYDDGAGTRYDPNNWYTVKVSLSGNQISIYINGTPRIQVTDADITRGMIGLFCYAQQGAQFDDVLVETTTMPPTTTSIPRITTTVPPTTTIPPRVTTTVPPTTTIPRVPTTTTIPSAGGPGISYGNITFQVNDAEGFNVTMRNVGVISQNPLTGALATQSFDVGLEVRPVAGAGPFGVALVLTDVKPATPGRPSSTKGATLDFTNVVIVSQGPEGTNIVLENLGIAIENPITRRREFKSFRVGLQLEPLFNAPPFNFGFVITSLE